MNGDLLINYAGPWKTFKHVSAQRIFTVQGMEQWQWELLRKADARYLGGQLEELEKGPFSADLLDRAAEIVLPQLTEMADRYRQQLESNPRYQSNESLKARFMERITLIESVVEAYGKMQADKQTIASDLEATVAGSTCIMVLTASGTADIGVIPCYVARPMATF